jgi:hypothetical protein
MSGTASGAATLERWNTQAELWTSFASLLRSYSAAHGMNSTHQAVVEVSADSILMRVAEHWTSVAMQQGRVTVDQDWSEPGSIDLRGLELRESGEFVLPNGKREDMDMFAERLACEIFKRAAA